MGDQSPLDRFWKWTTWATQNHQEKNLHWHSQKALHCVIPRVLSHYLLPLGWIMKKVITIIVKWRPSWTPSWILQNAQGWPKYTRQILKMDHLGYPKSSRKKLTLTFAVPVQWNYATWLPGYSVVPRLHSSVAVTKRVSWTSAVCRRRRLHIASLDKTSLIDSEIM